MATSHESHIGGPVDDLQSRLTADIQRGDYEGAVRRVESIETMDPQIALLVAQARVRQGRVNDALAVLDAASRDNTTPGTRLLLDVQQAATLVLRDLRFQEALGTADRAFEHAPLMEISAGNRAEAELLRCQIIRMARVYFEVDAATHERATDRLLELAEHLQEAGRLDASFHALTLHATGTMSKQFAPDRLADLASDAGERGLWHRAGEIHLHRARSLMKTGAPPKEIEPVIVAAEEAFDAADHVHGPIDVQLARTDLAAQVRQREDDISERMWTNDYTLIQNAYRETDYPRGELDVLNRRSQRAHAEGRTADAEALRTEIFKLVEGMGVAPDPSLMALIDLQTRSQSFADAIDVAEAALSQVRSRFRRSNYHQFLASTYMSTGRTDKAEQEARRAYDGYVTLGADEAASGAAHILADILAKRETEKGYDEAIELLRRWKLRDQERGDEARAAWHAEHKAGLHVRRYYNVMGSANTRAASKADTELSAADAEAAYVKRHLPALPEPDRSQREGGYWQTRTQIAIARNRTDDAAAYSQKAVETFDQAGLKFEAANSLYLSGLFALNAANQQVEPHFGDAETRLMGALSRYEEMGMRENVAHTWSKLACLYVNTASRFPSSKKSTLRDQLEASALTCLDEAEDLYDAIRREFDIGTPQDRRQTKQALDQGRLQVYPLALRVTASHQRDPASTWAWVQGMKARALTDGIALADAQIDRVIDQGDDPEVWQWVQEERDLARELIDCTPADRPVLRAEQKELHRRMIEHPELQTYLQVRTGGVFPEELLSEFLATPLAEGQSCVCVDWFELDGQYWLVTRSFGATSGYALEPTSVSVDVVGQMLQRIQTQRERRDFYRYFADELRRLDPLVAPLRHHARPDDLLVFVPTGLLHRLPLHALQIDARTVLDRHPVVYSPSLTTFGHCMARSEAPRLRTAAVLANPTEDVPGAHRIADDLQERLEATLHAGRGVTRARFLEAIQNVDLVHFHGHASFNEVHPLDSCLHLHGESVRARDIFDLPGVQASLVTLAACETGTQSIDTGDEPLGLIPAFLTAGAGSVLAMLWPVAAEPTQAVLEAFYEMITPAGDASDARFPLDRAETLRRAVLGVRETSGWEAPYYWAAFTLHGDWRPVGAADT